MDCHCPEGSRPDPGVSVRAGPCFLLVVAVVWSVSPAAESESCHVSESYKRGQTVPSPWQWPPYVVVSSWTKPALVLARPCDTFESGVLAASRGSGHWREQLIWLLINLSPTLGVRAPRPARFAQGLVSQAVSALWGGSVTPGAWLAWVFMWECLVMVMCHLWRPASGAVSLRHGPA